MPVGPCKIHRRPLDDYLQECVCLWPPLLSHLIVVSVSGHHIAESSHPRFIASGAAAAKVSGSGIKQTGVVSCVFYDYVLISAIIVRFANICQDFTNIPLIFSRPGCGVRDISLIMCINYNIISWVPQDPRGCALSRLAQVE